MGLTLIEKILASHSDNPHPKPGDIIDIKIDARIARDFGGANVVKNLEDNNLSIENPKKTFFTFDCNPGGSDQKYATNQHICRLFARNNNIKTFDINAGIGTHIAIDQGLVGPGDTIVSTDSHANILGAIGAFGQGMGDQDIAHAWAFGKVWFKVPKSIKVTINGNTHKNISAKDIALLLLKEFGANGLLGYAAEFYGPVVDQLTLDQRITIASMCTEMGGIIALFPPNKAVIKYCTNVAKKTITPIYTDTAAKYDQEVSINLDNSNPMISRPGHPEDVTEVKSLLNTKIDSVFIGSCTNGRLEDLRTVAEILKKRTVAPGVVLKIVPATDAIWKQCLDEGLIAVFKKAGALVGNAGCAGCAAGQIGQNGPNEVTISTGNRNFTGKQGKGKVYLSSPAIAAASAVAGVICLPDQIPAKPVIPQKVMNNKPNSNSIPLAKQAEKKLIVTGRVWFVDKDNIDTDMIYHNRYLTITDIKEMGRYTFDNLEGWQDFAQKAQASDIIITGKNFGCGSSRQQAVDCFKALGISLIIAKSFGAIYERNAINAGFPIMTTSTDLELKDGQIITVDMLAGKITIKETESDIQIQPLSEVQKNIYQKGGLLVRECIEV